MSQKKNKASQLTWHCHGMLASGEPGLGDSQTEHLLAVPVLREEQNCRAKAKQVRAHQTK